MTAARGRATGQQPADEGRGRRSPAPTGTKTPETRSASRCTSALPLCACSTSRASWASWVSAPILVARTRMRPPEFTVAPTTSDPGPTSTGTGSPVSMDASTALVPSTTTPSVATASPGRTTKTSPTTSVADRDPLLGAVQRPVADDGDVLGAQADQGPQRGARAAPRPGLGVPTGEQEHGDHGGDLEVAVAAQPPADHRPGRGHDDAEADQGVHGRGTVPGVGPGGPVERPGPPGDDRQRPGRARSSASPGRAARGPSTAGSPARPAPRRPTSRRRSCARLRRRTRRPWPGPASAGGVVARRLDDPHELSRAHPGRRRSTRGGRGGVVDGRDDAVHLVELLLDPGGARRAGHPARSLSSTALIVGVLRPPRAGSRRPRRGRSRRRPRSSSDVAGDGDGRRPAGDQVDVDVA